MAPSSAPIVILAGAGRLPLLLSDTLRRTARDHRILAFRGFADAVLRRRADAVVDLLDVRRALACLSEWRPSAVTLAGGVQRPKASAVIGAFSFLSNRRELTELMARGDDRLLRRVVSLLEERGHSVIGPHEIAPELLAGEGVLGRVRPDAALRRSIDTGLSLLADLSHYDVGQAAVIAVGRVLAIEGPEGTDRMLRRVPRRRRWTGQREHLAGVALVKAAKRGQDLRVDMPAIGPRTVAEAARAGLSGIAVGAGSTLILDRESTVEAADRLGLALLGVAPSPGGGSG
jgi:UDP-2,3-diacylglucosamine hydrolase